MTLNSEAQEDMNLPVSTTLPDTNMSRTILGFTIL